MFVCTYGVLWMINQYGFSSLPLQWQLTAIVGTVTFTCIIPLIPTYILIRQGIISDMYIKDKKQRTMPYVFSVVSYSFWVMFLLRTLHLPFTIVVAGVGAVVALIVIMIVNFKWKISAHLCGMGALLGFVSGVSFIMAVNPLETMVLILCLAALTALSRIGLKAHTPLQTLIGFVVGFLFVFLPCWLTVSFF